LDEHRDTDPLSWKRPARAGACRSAGDTARLAAGKSVKNEGPALLVQQHPLLFKQAPSKVVIL
jgi:hypothetical protein